MTVRRLKTYTGATGYVYQYYFVGKRPAIARAGEPPSTEYVFDASSDRKTTHAISVFLPQPVLDAWAKSRGRSLTDAEQYAVVKMRLFQAFDELDDLLRDSPPHSALPSRDSRNLDLQYADLQNHKRQLVVDSAALETALATLGVE